jgi:hypothetical protein
LEQKDLAPVAILRQPYRLSKLATSVDNAARALAPDVVRIRFSVKDDWSGDESIFFRVVLSDEASDISRLYEVSQRIQVAIDDEVKDLGLQTYFNFRSLSETKQLKDAAWE